MPKNPISSILDTVDDLCYTISNTNKTNDEHHEELNIPNIVDSGPIHVVSVYTRQIPDGKL